MPFALALMHSIRRCRRLAWLTPAIRHPVTQPASQGLSENEIGRAPISMMARSTNAPFSVTEPTSKDCPVTIGGVAAALDYGNKSFGSSSRSPQTFFQIAFARSTITSKSIEQSAVHFLNAPKPGLYRRRASPNTAKTRS